MKVLITGAEGYIGTQLGPFLIERGHEVVGLDTGFYRDGWLWDMRSNQFPTAINLDVRQITVDQLRGFDAVVHLAELSNDPLGDLHPDTTHNNNYLGSLRLASLCKDAEVGRFVYSSSCSVYGIGSSEFLTEESEVKPMTAYATNKVLVERHVAELADDGFSPVFLRNATAYGFSPRMRFDLVLNNLAGLAWTKGEIRMTSDGTPWRPLVHVLDICKAVACVLDAPRDSVHNEIFNVGATDENYRVKQIAEIVAETFPNCRILFGDKSDDNRSYRVSFEKIAKRLPEFTCNHSAASGARELRTVFEATAMNSETFESRAYTRLAQIKYLLSTGQVSPDLYWSIP